MERNIDLLRQRLLGLRVASKRVLAASVDVAIVVLALWLAFFVRLNYAVNPIEYWELFLIAPLTAMPVFFRLGVYRAVLRYMGRDAIATLFNAATIATLLLALAIYWMRSDQVIPRSLVFNYWALLLLLMGGSRFVATAFLVPDSLRRRFSLRPGSGQSTTGGRRIAIYGAGSAGFQLYLSLLHDKEISPVGFIDDDPDLKGRSVGGLKVYGRDAVADLVRETGTREVFLAMPSIGPGRKREILDQLESYPVHVRTVPSIYELTTGRKDVGQLQEIRVEDILGREIVQPVPDLLERCVRDQTVMITGAGGSIGSELSRQIVELRPRRLVLFEHSEFNLFEIEEELRADIDRRTLDVDLVSILGSIVNSTQLTNVMSSFEVNTVYHAAAYKHVPIVEHNMAAGLRNNVFGTVYTAQAAIAAGVENFVLISTDKAVRPTNVMGATKRLAEMVLQALAAEQSSTRFTMVRFGNVLGSSGSVIPKFRKQIRTGGPVTVTHPEVTRYFMTIPEAAQLVIQAGSMGSGGDVFVLDMGEPVRILDLATTMIRLFGLSVRNEANPEGDIEIAISGLRPGEKLYEELLIGDNVGPTGHPMIRRAEESMLPWTMIEELLGKIQQALDADDYLKARELLALHVDGFEPSDTLVDWMHGVDQGSSSSTNDSVTFPHPVKSVG